MSVAIFLAAIPQPLLKNYQKFLLRTGLLKSALDTRGIHLHTASMPMMLLFSAFLAFAPSARAYANWKDSGFQFNPKSQSWSREGGEAANYNIFNPNNNFVARFEHGHLKILFDNYPDAGPKEKPDTIYVFRDADMAERLGQLMDRSPAPIDL